MEDRTGAARPDDWWGRVARTKPFAHPLDRERFARRVAKDARVLDLGCGFGRTLAELRDLGWTNAVGADPSPGMIEQGRAARPDLDLVLTEGTRLPFGDGAFDAVLLFAVLTGVPADGDQRALVAEARRVLRPGGLLYVSDCLLNDDARNLARYEVERSRPAPRGRWGTFALDEGAVFRHHDRAWLRELFADFEEEEFVPFVATTMNGNRTKAFQAFLRRR